MIRNIFLALSNFSCPNISWFQLHVILSKEKWKKGKKKQDRVSLAHFYFFFLFLSDLKTKLHMMHLSSILIVYFKQ